MTTPHAFPFIRAMPVLDCSDIAATLAFWKDKLGFDAATWGEPPTFAIVQRGTASIAFALMPKDKVAVSRNWAAYLYVQDVDALYKEYEALGVALPHPPETRDYGCREFVIDDPDGHIIAFGQVLNPDPLGPGLGTRVGRDGKAAPP
jgi:predicted enzyme related to lactoylglutathione lyase